jgi:myosin heavy subunit
MQFQFTEVATIQQQIEALTAQLQHLTASVAPYTECEAVASELVTKVAEHRELMSSKGLASNSLHSWAIALFEAGSGEQMETSIESDNELYKLQQELHEARTALHDEAIAHKKRIDETAALQSEIKAIALDYEEIKKKYDFFISSMRETDDLSIEVTQIRKENEDYQQRYDGMKAQKEQVEGDFYAVRAEHDFLKVHINKLEVASKTQLKILPTIEISSEVAQEVVQPQQQAAEKILQINDIVNVPLGGCGTITGFNEDGCVIVAQIVHGETVEVSYESKDLQWLSSYVITPEPEINLEQVQPSGTDKYEQFLAKIARTYAWNNLNWEEVRSHMNSDAKGFTEIIETDLLIFGYLTE